MAVELLIDNEICSHIPSRQLLESDFEESLLEHKSVLFPGWYVCSFKSDVDAFSTPHGRKRADLALVDPGFLTWWVVEVELSHHSVQQHVAPQVEVLALGEYNAQHARILSRKLRLSTEEAAMLANLLANRQPRVLVVVNDYVVKWEPLIKDFSEIMVVRPYADRLGRQRYIVDGFRPSKGNSFISPCTREPAMPRSLLISEPNRVSFTSGQRLRILVDNSWTLWTYYLLGKNAFLFASGFFPFERAREFVLGHDGNGNLFLRPMNSHIRRQLK